jgi:hypothetical protein
VEDRLALLARQGTAIPVGAGRVEFPSLQVSEITIDLDGAHARALFRAEGQGRLGDIHVGYIGGEAIALVHGRAGWEPEGGLWLPRLAGVLDALRRRNEALSRGDRAALAALALDPKQSPLAPSEVEGRGTSSLRSPRAWLIRIEGEGAVVSEVSEPSGSGGKDGAGATRRLELRRQGTGWRFASGLL